MKYVPRKQGETVIQDDWRHAKVPNRDMEQLWTGRTVFKIAKQTEADTVTSTDTSSFGLKEEDFPHYEGDTWPAHWSEARKEEMRVKYKGIPEEYYTKQGESQLLPATCGHGWQLLQARTPVAVLGDVPGSGGLSLVLLTASVMTGFPVDYRYGWDLAHPEHQGLLRQCYQSSSQHTFLCSNVHSLVQRLCSQGSGSSCQERQRELPTLEFLHEILLQQHNQNRGFSLEQPWSSAMLIDSPIARLRDVAGVRVWRTDQCMLGARDERTRPFARPPVSSATDDGLK